MFNLNVKILVVDDMSAMRKLVIKACRELGFTDFTEAADAAQAWQALTIASPPIGLVISDWNMPHSSGMDFLKRVRAHANYANLPFLLVAAEAEQTQIKDALQYGFSNCAIKPLTSKILTEKLEAVHKKMVA